MFQGARLATAGLVLNVSGAAALTPLMSSLLYGVKAWDPMVYAADCALLMVIALLATYIPARRASQIDPSQTLRWE